MMGQGSQMPHRLLRGQIQPWGVMRHLGPTDMRDPLRAIEPRVPPKFEVNGFELVAQYVEPG
jgi:hypothetical protein